MILPLGEGERASGTFRFGFGAMRKKPSPSLCRASVDAGNGPAPVIELPEALSSSKTARCRTSCTTFRDGKLRADKIACARITLADPDGDVVSARMVWETARAGHEPLPHGAKGYRPVRACGRGIFFDRPGGIPRGAGDGTFPPAGPRVFERSCSGPRERSGVLLPDRRAPAGRRLRGTVAEPEGGRNWVVTFEGASTGSPSAHRGAPRPPRPSHVMRRESASRGCRSTSRGSSGALAPRRPAGPILAACAGEDEVAPRRKRRESRPG